jgi:hypothetical protein
LKLSLPHAAHKKSPPIRGKSDTQNKLMGYQSLKWLGRQDSNLGMAESKSKCFLLFIKAHSGKMRKFDLNSIRRLTGISECRDTKLTLAPCPPKAEVTSSNLVGRTSDINKLRRT